MISYILLSLSCSAWSRAKICIYMAHIFPLQTINISQFGLTARNWQTEKVDSLGCHNREEAAGLKSFNYADYDFCEREIWGNHS